MVEEVVVGFVQLAEVALVQEEVLGVASSPIPLAPAEHVDGRLQVHHEVGRRHVGGEQVEHPLIDEQLVVVEAQVRVDFVLVEEVIGHCRLTKEIRLAESDRLAVPGQEEEELRLECGAGAALLHVGDEGILPIFEGDRRVEPRAQTLGERRLARPRRSLDRDVAAVQPAAV